MAWEISRAGRSSTLPSTLVGAAHWFPSHFRHELRRLIEPARVVLLEGPLDEAATKKVLEAGRGTGGAALYQAAKNKIHARLGIYSAPFDMNQMLKNLVFGRQEQWLEEELRKLKPWAAFFGIWSRYRDREGWVHRFDLDAAAIAAQLSKPVRYLESIEEQIAALEAVPAARFERFLVAGDWRRYNDEYQKFYRAGDLDALAAAAVDFPTYCEPVIGRRDAVLAERMESELNVGGACIVIGVAHCRAVLPRLAERGFSVNTLF